MFAILAPGRLKQKSSRPFWEIQQDIGGGVERERGREAGEEKKGGRNGRGGCLPFDISS